MRLLASSLILGGLVLLAASPAGAQTPENEAMAQSVADSLKLSGRLKKYRVGVKYQDGVAWLLGTVASQEQSDTAQSIAEDVPGVAKVVNKLEIAREQQPRFAAPDTETEVQLAAGPLADSQLAQTRLASSIVPPPPAVPRLGPEPQQPRPISMSQPSRASRLQPTSYPVDNAVGMTGGPVPMGYAPQGMARQVAYDHPSMPGYAWPSYASYPNYAALTYPQQYSPAAWPYIGPFYPYPQVPLGWRKVTLEWDDGWWFLDFHE